ncbi:hypothetical protein COCCADRAFT_38766 [Bipolaris zeicola 26-R-13]|uniref:Cytochrome P450 n=1 Tax=Cochliobolus carbonum (strain 26-R-13) TaxID=930089 RepID=W6XTW2_COCC2|nr:uncharacterized protein COCCADRAFT_38766 [Bipolaris zeicola 26-R-13]EUC31077.1 hypothetical protein COCCADRAFT_38766 [Bipolaris zeicola 26-R-13]
MQRVVLSSVTLSNGTVIPQSYKHFVTGSPKHLEFGYGRHTCPGRFFASIEVKIIVVYLLIEYDWKFTEKGRLPTPFAGAECILNDKQKVVMKRR